MSREAKIVVTLVGALFLVCICGVIAVASVFGIFGAAVGRVFDYNSAQVEVLADRIADFELPAEYQPNVSVNLAGFEYASYGPGDGHSHIMLIQAPPSLDVDQATLEKYAQQASSEGSYSQQTRSQVVGKQQVTIRGQQVTMVISEGTNHDGELYRSLTGVFQGKRGLTLLSIEEPASGWDQERVDAFIASIR